MTTYEDRNTSVYLLSLTTTRAFSFQSSTLNSDILKQVISATNSIVIMKLLAEYADKSLMTKMHTIQNDSEHLQWNAEKQTWRETENKWAFLKC